MIVENKNTVDPSDAALKVLSAFASRENATVEDVLSLARQLPNALSGITGAIANAGEAPKPPVPTAVIAHPAVPVSKSVTNDTVTCLCCGRSFTMLKRHLKAEHGLTEDQYRLQFDLPEDHPLVAPNYSIRKAEYAKRIGLGKYARDDSTQQSGRPSV